MKVVEPAILAITRAIGILSPPRPSITDNLPLISHTPAQPPSHVAHGRSVMITIYQLKPRFQSLLRPGVQALARRGTTANQVTLLACGLSLLVGIILSFRGADSPGLFLLLPV